jgi:KaiC/GvpD/RAD55 family RecA-like ATPase
VSAAREQSGGSLSLAARRLERSVLGAVLVDPGLFEAARAIVTETGLLSQRLRAIWGAIEDLHEGGVEPSLPSLVAELDRREQLDSVGGAAYLSRLQDDGTPSRHLGSYGAQLRDLHGRLGILRSLEDAVERIRHASENGSSSRSFAELVHVEAHKLASIAPARAVSRALDLATVRPTAIEYAVRDLIRRKGVHVLYARRSVGKTYLLLRLVSELLAGHPAELFGHPALRILSPWRRVLWVSTEETGGALRFRWDMVLAGMRVGSPSDLRGELRYAWAFDQGAPVTLDAIDPLLDAAGEVDALVLDSWTGLAPATMDGVRIEWDRDNYATRRVFCLLRDACERRGIALIIVHHEGKDPSAGPRGASEMENGADTVIKLERRPGGTPVERTIRIVVEKQRDGIELPPFDVTRRIAAGACDWRYQPPEDTPEIVGPALTVMAFLRGIGEASTPQIESGTGLTRAAVRRSLETLLDGRAVEPGRKGPHNTRFWRVAPADGHQMAGTEE